MYFMSHLGFSHQAVSELWESNLLYIECNTFSKYNLHITLESTSDCAYMYNYNNHFANHMSSSCIS